jgi:hypothetical protein
MERLGAFVKGIYRDVLRGPDGTVVHDSGWVANTIVDGCRVLLTEFMRDGSGSGNGITHLAVGQGLEAWDAAGAPAPSPETTDGLENGHDPPMAAADLDMVYLDETDAASPDPTSRLQITATLEPGYPPHLPDLTTYPLREFGLFGSSGATGYMINCIRHPVIHKDESMTLVRTLRLYF